MLKALVCVCDKMPSKIAVDVKEKLIEYVKHYPQLYDKSNSDYKDRNVIDIIWTEISLKKWSLKVTIYIHIYIYIIYIYSRE